MRLISFAMTKESFADGSKTVTRRLGWKTLHPGAKLMGVEKAQGLKPGEKIVRLGALEVLDVRREPLQAINSEPSGAAREGFPKLLPNEFVRLFCEAMGCTPETIVTRIEFKRLPDGWLTPETLLEATVPRPAAKSPPECEDCGDPAKRRTRCRRCNLLVCSWCWGHVHGNTALTQAVRGSGASS